MLFRLLLLVAALASNTAHAQQWSLERAWQWYNNTPWIVGSQYIPKTASNQLEMWQSETYDPETIDSELALMASGPKMNTIRVFLHYLPWWYDDLNPNNASEAFLARIDHFLSIAQKHGIRVMLVLLDDCWDPYPHPGPQLPPRPRVIGSRWLQNPGNHVLYNETAQDELVKPFVLGVMKRFAQDERVIIWDLYNEPGQVSYGWYGETADKKERTHVMIQKVYAWAREANVSQPVTTDVYIPGGGAGIDRTLWQFSLDNSDIITFHSYEEIDAPNGYVFGEYMPLRELTKRPLVCTEYMARPRGSTFASILPYAKAMKIGSINWGFVNGKVECNYPWDSWAVNYTGQPKLWFHDIYWGNHTPYDQKEVDLIAHLITTNPN